MTNGTKLATSEVAGLPRALGSRAACGVLMLCDEELPNLEISV